MSPWNVLLVMVMAADCLFKLSAFSTLSIVFKISWQKCYWAFCNWDASGRMTFAM